MELGGGGSIKKRKAAHLHTFELKKGCKPNQGLEKKIFRCVSPDCWFYVRASFLLGKRATCPRCLLPFILTSESLKLRKPHCESCTNSPKVDEKKTQLQQIQSEVSKLLGLGED
jgi:hypothetical protein